MKILEDYKKIAHELLFEVDDDKMIKYKDREMSLSASALEIVQELGYTWSKISGPEYWHLDGKSLYQMRIERDV